MIRPLILLFNSALVGLNVYFYNESGHWWSLVAVCIGIVAVLATLISLVVNP